MFVAIAQGSMTNTISISMTTNLIFDDFVTFFHQHYNAWDDIIEQF